jgi:hypothetical protein
MLLVRLFAFAACLMVSGFSFGQTVYTWYSGQYGNFTTTANDCASVGTGLINVLGAGWGWSGSCTGGDPSSGYTLMASRSGAGYDLTITPVSGSSPPIVVPSLVGGSGLQYVIECVSNGGSVAVSPCTSVGSVGYAPVMYQAYVVDPSLGAAFVASQAPMDYTLAGEFFAFGFTGIALLFFSSHGIGLVLKSVRGKF